MSLIFYIFFFLTFKLSAMQYWVDQGAPPRKLNMGFAACGRAFTISSEFTSVVAPASGPGEEGCYTGREGFRAFYEVKLDAVIIIFFINSPIKFRSPSINPVRQILVHNVEIFTLLSDMPVSQRCSDTNQS